MMKPALPPPLTLKKTKIFNVGKGHSILVGWSERPGGAHPNCCYVAVFAAATSQKAAEILCACPLYVQPKASENAAVGGT